MPKKSALVLLASQFLWICLLSAHASESGELASKLSTNVHDYNLVADNFAEALTKVAGEFSIPIGIVWINTPTAKTQLILHWKDTTLGEILRTIVRTQPGYGLRMNDGIVHVSTSEISSAQNFLVLQLGSFVVRHEVVQVAERRLEGMIKQITVRSEPSSGGVGGSLAVNVGEPTIDLQVNDANVEDILDSLIKVSNKKIWIVTFSENPAPTPAGFRRTLTLWSSSPVPDNEQPVWNMFGWGDRLPSAWLSAH